MAFNINLPQKHERYNNRAAFPQTGSEKILYVANDTLKLYTYGNSTYTEVDKELASSWGSVSQAPKPTTTSVSKTDIGLDNVDNTSDADKPISTATQTALNLKVDKIAGKGLSTNDYTTTEQTKLAGIAAGAEVNVNADWNAVSGDAQILNKPTIPSTAGLATTSYVDSQNSTKQNALGFTPENVANKSISVAGDKTSDTKYPSVKSVWDWVVSAFQPLLVSGTNIKTVNSTSLLGSGDVSVGVTGVTGTSPISSTGGATPAISIATATTSTTGALTSTDWNTFNGKQAPLVSGTNIKTINGSSVLGSGDLAISGGASGMHTMLLGGGSLFGGIETTNSVALFNATTYTSQDQMLYFPYIPNNSFTATTFTFQVNNATVGGLARLCIYSHNGINAPLNRLYQSTDISLATSGSKTISVSYSFVKGTVYWFGLQTNIFNSQITGMNSNGGVLPIGNIGTTQVAGWVQVSLTYASGAPATAAPNSYSSNIPLIRLK